MAKHVVIIGAGVIGLCCGHYLTQRGFRVTIVDQSAADYRGCSFGNAGLVVPSHFVPLAAPGMVRTALRMMLNPRSPFYIRPRLDRNLFDWMWKFRQSANAGHVARSAPLLRDLNFASRACYEELAANTGDFELTKNGLLMLCNTQHGFHEEIAFAEQSNRLGIPARILDPQQTVELEPGIQMKIAGSVYFPLDSHLSPDLLMASLRRQLTDAGATFLWNTEVNDWLREGGRIAAIRTANDVEIPADEFVLCTGSWSRETATTLGLRLPMQPGKGYSLTLENPPRFPKLCAILTEARVAMTPMGRRLRFGGTMEMSGLNHAIYRNRVEGIINSACAYYPELSKKDFENITPWCGLRPCSPDGLPYIGRTRKYSNLGIATGHAMMGISLGPISGKIIAEIIDGQPPEIDVALLDPDRYAKNWNRDL